MSRYTFVDVTYDGGLDWDLDEKIRELMKKDNDSSGCMMFGKCTRDMQFAFRSEAKAKRVSKLVVDYVRETPEYKGHNFHLYLNGEEV